MTVDGILQAEAGQGERRAAGLDRLAGELEREAAALVGRLDGLTSAFTDAVWRGQAADRSRDHLRSARVRARGAADELCRVAGLLGRRAGDARAEASALRRPAELVRTASPV